MRLGGEHSRDKPRDQFRDHHSFHQWRRYRSEGSRRLYNATALCQAAGKNFHDYERLQRTQDFLAVLSQKTGIPAFGNSGLVQAKQRLGTWVHPQVAISLAMWCSPEFEEAVTAWVIEWSRTRRNPLESPLQPYHDFLQLVRDVKALLEDLGMYEPPDRLRLADTTRNVLLAAQGQLQLPGHTAFAPQVPTDEGRMWSVGERLIGRGYPPRYASTEDQRGHRYLVRIGKIMSRKFQQRHGQPPVKTSRYVDGAIRKVCVYTARDLDLLDAAIEEVLGAPPAGGTTPE